MDMVKPIEATPVSRNLRPSKSVGNVNGQRYFVEDGKVTKGKTLKDVMMNWKSKVQNKDINSPGIMRKVQTANLGKRKRNI